MLVSEWKENFEGFGVWSATNCLTEGIHPPKIAALEAGSKGFGVFGTFGDNLNCGESFETFEEAAKWMETVFTFEVKNGWGTAPFEDKPSG